MNKARFTNGGLIDRNRSVSFTFNGRKLQGYRGDTLASALLANGIRVVARSFKYHRPRGIYAAGPEEPNALVRIGEADRAEPNHKATEIELYDGLVAASQNCWPSVDFDFGAAAGFIAPFIPAGFYYKTFMGPGKAWRFYEWFIRQAAGQGQSPLDADPDRYEHRYAHCDVLIVGSGLSGMAAANAAALTGARVILADENPNFGGGLRGQRIRLDELPALDWVNQTIGRLEETPDVTLLSRASVFGYYDHNLLGIIEKLDADYSSNKDTNGILRQRLWHVRAKQVILATGAIERPLIFANNDLPGIMLASAAQRYVNEFAVRAGRRAVVFTNNDTAYTVALDLSKVGIDVVAIVDTRAAPNGKMVHRAQEAGISCFVGQHVVQAYGRKSLQAVELQSNVASDGKPDGASDGQAKRLACDLLCISGGWNPNVNLFSQSGGRLNFREDIDAFVPGQSKQKVRTIGAANGTFEPQSCLAEGIEAGVGAAKAVGYSLTAPNIVPHASNVHGAQPTIDALAPTNPRYNRGKVFVDLQNDVTEGDLALAIREGYDSVEHLKRYTTLGMGTDQGKTSNMNGFTHLASTLGVTVPQVGTTTFRPAYTPVTIGALTGSYAGPRLDPVRQTPIHPWHKHTGAIFVTAGLWLRPRYYPRQEGATVETMADAVNREVRAVRGSAGIVDISTLGKIDIQGRDAAEFLERVYVNKWKKLGIGRCRYGLMLREDGMVFDDGTTTQLAENRFHMTTTTANASTVMRHLEYHQQVVWPELDVHLTSVTDEWAGVALAGPKVRDVLEGLHAGIDFSNEAFPYMSYREGVLENIPLRIFRISFSGELAYEINVPADYGMALWKRLLDVGQSSGITPYGTETMAVMRIEKGHFVIGAEADGRIAPQELGLDRMLALDKGFIGKRALARKVFSKQPHQRLVGLIPEDGKSTVPRGAQIVQKAHGPVPRPMVGHVTSTCFSPTLDKPIALAMVDGLNVGDGDLLYAASPLTGETVAVLVTGSVFVDPEGERLRV